VPTLPLGTHASAPDVVVHAHAYSAPWRVIVGALVVLSHVSTLVIFALVLWSSDPPITPAVLFVLFGALVLAPALLAWGIRRLSVATVEVDHLTMAISRRGFRLEVPNKAIKEVMPWVVPLPGPGFSLRMGSGRRLRYGVETAESSKLLQALVDTAEVSVAEVAVCHPSLVYAAAKSASCPSGWGHIVLKFVLFSLFPALVLFNAHQHIAYGGTFGEYYLLGLRSYLGTFLIYWATTGIYLVLYAGVWRALAEAVSLAAAWVARVYAEPTRRIAEHVCRAAYYGGVPLLLLIRFLP
jgi:hypothetical protein